MKLSVNVDHIASLRQARRASEPEPVLAALLAEQAGAAGVTVHLRGDSRHINERDVRLLRETVKTKLTVEMAATPEMKKAALSVHPDVVCLVPEKSAELTTTGGLDVLTHRQALKPHVQALAKAGIRVSIFVDPALPQIRAIADLGVPQIEIHTGIYAEAGSSREREKAMEEIRAAATAAARLGLEVTGGHGLDYHNVGPIVAIPEMTELSIGFSIIARAAIAGMDRAVRDMVALLNHRRARP
ncbi:MAG: pyridoxine 5'-phosphate synthase [Candidatus Aminicenantes bacterium]|nr:pyridoxine 5'-phosphate synthase [Candidatus Aminicenantes bacterium]